MEKSRFKYLSALLLSGSNGIVASYVMLSSYEIVFFRALIGSLFLAAVFLISGGKPRAWKSPRHLGYLAISGVATGLGWMFLYEAYVRIGVSAATLAYYTGPVIVIMLSPLVFHERLTGAKLLGFAAVLAGMLFVNCREIVQCGVSWGLVCGALSAVSYAFMVIFNKKATDITGLENPMLQLAISFLTVAVFTLVKRGEVPHIAPGSAVPILFLGVVNTGFGCYLYFTSLGKLPAQTVAICGYLEPLSALVFSAVLLKERLTPIQMLGAALILSGASLGEILGRKHPDFHRRTRPDRPREA